MIGSYFGARLTGRVDPNRLRLLIAVMLAVVGPLVIYRAIIQFPD